MIRGLYHSVLDRDVEPFYNGNVPLNYWQNVVYFAQQSMSQDPYQVLAKGFWESREHRYREVESYYHNFLGRDLDLNNPN